MPPKMQRRGGGSARATAKAASGPSAISVSAQPSQDEGCSLRAERVRHVHKMLAMRGESAEQALKERVESGSGVSAKGLYFEPSVLKEALERWAASPWRPGRPTMVAPTLSTFAAAARNAVNPEAASGTSVGRRLSKRKADALKGQVETEVQPAARTPKAARTQAFAASPAATSKQHATADVSELTNSSLRDRLTVRVGRYAVGDLDTDHIYTQLSSHMPAALDAVDVDSPPTTTIRRIARTRMPVSTPPGGSTQRKRGRLSRLGAAKLTSSAASASAVPTVPKTLYAQRRPNGVASSQEENGDNSRVHEIRCSSPPPQSCSSLRARLEAKKRGTAASPAHGSSPESPSASVKELKKALIAAGIDISGCVEKAELEALWEVRLGVTAAAQAAASAEAAAAQDASWKVRTLQHVDPMRQTEAAIEVARILPLRREDFATPASWGFAVLGVATRDLVAVQRGYRTLIRKLHPDKAGSDPDIVRAGDVIREAKDACERSLSRQEPPGAPRNLQSTMLCAIPGKRRFRLNWNVPEGRDTGPVRRYIVAAVDPAYGRALTFAVLEPDYNEELRRFISVEELTSHVLAEEELQKMPELWKQATATVQVAAANEAGQSAWAIHTVTLSRGTPFSFC